MQEVRTGPPSPSTTGVFAELDVAGCREVTVQDSVLNGGAGVVARDVTLAITASTIAGQDAVVRIDGQITGPGAGLIVSSGSVHLSRCDVSGGNGVSTFLMTRPPAPGIAASAGTLVVTGDASNSIVAGALAGAPPLPGIQADNGTLDIDPSVVVQGSQGGPPIAGSATVVTRRIVALSAGGGTLGGPIAAEIVSPAGDALALLLSLPIDPIPTVLGTVYFDPLPALGIVYGATQNASEHFTVAFTFPNVPQLRGAAVVLQAANYYRATAILELSNPVVLVLDTP